MHGSGFEKQLTCVRKFLRGTPDALLLTDANRVVCERWRPGSATVHLGFKRLCGWECACCGRQGAAATTGGIVGGDGAETADEGESVGFTRYETVLDEGRRRRWSRPTGRLDVAVAFGGERGAWRLEEQMRMEAERAGSVEEAEGRPLSDHKMIVVKRQLADVAGARKRRKRAVALKGGSRLARAVRERLRGASPGCVECSGERRG